MTYSNLVFHDNVKIFPGTFNLERIKLNDVKAYNFTKIKNHNKETCPHFVYTPYNFFQQGILYFIEIKI